MPMEEYVKFQQQIDCMTYEQTMNMLFLIVSTLQKKQSQMSINERANAAIKSCQELSAINGNSEMTLEEINAEIDAYRKGL